MNVDRLLRDVEARISGLTEGVRHEVMDALHEAVARERRWRDPSLTVEAERERRQQAEELKGALEAIHTSVRPDEALDEVLKQLGRVVALDFAAVATRDPGGAFRVLAVRGGEPDRLLGTAFAGEGLETAGSERRPILVTDAEAEGAAMPLPGAPSLRSWVALPLMLEADVIGVLLAGRLALDSFTEDDVSRAKALAFWAAAALRRGQLLSQVQRYAALLEQVVRVDQGVFRGDDLDALAQVILEGALHVGQYPGGLLVTLTKKGAVVRAVSGGALAGVAGRAVPTELAPAATSRLPPGRLGELLAPLPAALPVGETYLVPLATAESHLGGLVLIDPSGESLDDRLLESYASRAAAAWDHAARHHRRH